jgi:hypothetical protein
MFFIFSNAQFTFSFKHYGEILNFVAYVNIFLSYINIQKCKYS